MIKALSFPGSYRDVMRFFLAVACLIWVAAGAEHAQAVTGSLESATGSFDSQRGSGKGYAPDERSATDLRTPLMLAQADVKDARDSKATGAKAAKDSGLLH